MTEIELFDYLLNNRVELLRQIKPEIESILKNREMFLAFEFKDRMKEEVDKILISLIINLFKNTNIEEIKILLESDKVSTALEYLFYDFKEYT
jgi:hypothetical protein